MSATRVALHAARSGGYFASPLLFLCLALALVWAFPQRASAYPAAVRSACKYDYKRLCPRYEIGTAKMRNCMRASVSGIAPRCYESLIKHGYAERRRAAVSN